MSRRVIYEPIQDASNVFVYTLFGIIRVFADAYFPSTSAGDLRTLLFAMRVTQRPKRLCGYAELLCDDPLPFRIGVA